MPIYLRALAFTGLFAMALAGCGGGTATKSTTTTSAAAPSEAQRETAALPMGAMAPMPALNCGVTKPVWVNMHTKAYHEPGDPYYGRTKAGKYLCPSAAVAAGYHAAGARHHGASNAMNGTSGNTSATDASGTMGNSREKKRTHHKKHHNGDMAPDAAATP